MIAFPKRMSWEISQFSSSTDHLRIGAWSGTWDINSEMILQVISKMISEIAPPCFCTWEVGCVKKRVILKKP